MAGENEKAVTYFLVEDQILNKKKWVFAEHLSLRLVLARALYLIVQDGIVEMPLRVEINGRIDKRSIHSLQNWFLHDGVESLLIDPNFIPYSFSEQEIEKLLPFRKDYKVRFR